MTSTISYYSISLDEKEEAGREVATNVTAARTGDPIAQALAQELERDSVALNTSRVQQPAAQTQRSGLTSQLRRLNKLRERSLLSFNHHLVSLTLRDDLPEQQAAASYVSDQLLPNGTSFVRMSHSEESAEMNSLLRAAKEPQVAQALATCNAQPHIDNIAKRQAEFEALSTARGEMHETALKTTRTLSQKERDWNASAKALLAYLDKIYLPGQRAERDRLVRPLLEANAKARSRSHRLPAETTAVPPAPLG